MIYRFEDIKGVHLEVTTKCNSNCPMCSRNAFGVVCKKLQLTELTLMDCKRIFSSAFLNQLKNISMCGAYGDPALAHELLEIIKYMRHNNPNIRIDIYTNGGIRSAYWWEKLAQIIGNGKVVFGIDGLEDTNHIYRRGTIFSLIIRNASAFIHAGGQAQWDFIVFKHNEHQVEQARELSKKIGFKDFQVKRTKRFCKVLYEEDPIYEGADEKFGKYPIYDSNGRKKGYLELPKNTNYCNDSHKTLEILVKQFGSLNQYLDKAPIDCKVKRNQEVFVNATGLVYPCCWIYDQANRKTLYNATDSFELGVENILNDIGGIYQISAKERSFKDIIEGEFFKRIEKSWNIHGLSKGRLKVCARACGRQMDMYEKEFENKTLIPGINYIENSE